MSNKRAPADDHSSATASSPSSKMQRFESDGLWEEVAGVEVCEITPQKGFEQQVVLKLKKPKEKTMDLT